MLVMKILIRFDDIAQNMNWDLMSKCEKLFDQLRIKPVMGVIPNNQDPELKTFPKIERVVLPSEIARGLLTLTIL